MEYRYVWAYKQGKSRSFSAPTMDTTSVTGLGGSVVFPNLCVGLLGSLFTDSTVKVLRKQRRTQTDAEDKSIGSSNY